MPSKATLNEKMSDIIGETSLILMIILRFLIIFC